MRISCTLPLLGLALLGITAAPGQAAVYKCRDAGGAVSYSQTPCSSDENTDKILDMGASGASGVECGIVQNFATEVGLAVEAGKPIETLAVEWGGEAALPDTAIRIMRSVYDYQSQPYKSVEESVKRETEICRDEHYGSPKCSDFPVNFIKDWGGCSVAGDDYKRRVKMAEVRTGNKRQSDNAVVQQRLARASEDAHSRQMRRQEKAECVADIDRQIKQNAKAARGANSASEQDRLRRERRGLMEARSDC